MRVVTGLSRASRRGGAPVRDCASPFVDHKDLSLGRFSLHKKMITQYFGIFNTAVYTLYGCNVYYVSDDRISVRLNSHE